jgi:hypothetical protein
LRRQLAATGAHLKFERDAIEAGARTGIKSPNN